MLTVEVRKAAKSIFKDHVCQLQEEIFGGQTRFRFL